MRNKNGSDLMVRTIFCMIGIQFQVLCPMMQGQISDLEEFR